MVKKNFNILLTGRNGFDRLAALREIRVKSEKKIQINHFKYETRLSM